MSAPNGAQRELPDVAEIVEANRETFETLAKYDGELAAFARRLLREADGDG